MKTNQKLFARASLALLALCGFSTFGVSPVMAEDNPITSVTSGNTNTLTVSTNSSGAVTITPVTGNISQSNHALVTGGTVYTELHSNNLNLGYRNTITAGKNYQTAVGSLNKIGDSADTAIGFNNNAKGGNSSAVGDNNTAEGVAASAMGSNNTASGMRSNALGYYNKTSKDYDSAVGVGNTASGSYSSALGGFNKSTGAASSALGYYNIASGKLSTAVGAVSVATADGATAIGYMAVATETGTVSFGHKSGDPMGYTDGKYDSNSFARLTNVADGKDVNDAATYGQIAAQDQTITNTQNQLKDNNGNVIATFKIGSASFTAGDNVEISDDNVISVKADGKVEAGNEGILTGGEVYDHLSGMKSDLEGQINKVGAGAAALAMLHPEGFDPANKWNFAVGYGHYKNANAGALGAFYKPNADTTVTVASTMGNGNPMFGAGVSFKIGHRGENFAPNASNAELANEVNRLRVENAQMKAQIAEILKKLELSETVQKTATH